MRRVSRKVAPAQFKAFSNSSQLSPLSAYSSSGFKIETHVLETDENLTPVHNNSHEETLLPDDDKFQRKIQKRSLLWMSTFLIAAVWLLGLSVIYLLHMRTEYPTIEVRSPEVVANNPITQCTLHDDCSAPTPYCDTLYSHKCSACLSSSHCLDASKPRCDVFGTRDCHGCLADRHCTGSLICDLTNTRTCVQCLRNNDCLVLGLTICDLGTNTCS